MHWSTEKFRKYTSPPYRCFFCGKRITVLRGLTAKSLIVHHKDGNRKNHDLANLVPAHNACHVSDALRGRPKTAEHRAKISASLRVAMLGNANAKK